MSNQHILRGRIKPFLCLLTLPLFLVTAGTASATQSLPSASYMQPYVTTLRSSFGTPPYSYALISGGLPPSVVLNQSGKITGTPTTIGNWIFQVRATDSSQQHVTQTVQYALSVSIGWDMYGGMTAMPSPNGATGYFRVEKNNGRWNFISPLGNVFYLLSAYVANFTFLQSGVLSTKYGNNEPAWAEHQNHRLLSWGFNTIGEYWSTYVLPVNTNHFTNNANPVKLPFIVMVNGIANLINHPTTYGLPEAPKDIVRGVPTTTYEGWRHGHMVDMFDPKIATGYQAVVAYGNSNTFTNGLAPTPWIVGITTDDCDYLFGLKNNGNSPASAHPHVAYLVATTMFQYTAAQNPNHVAYKDPKVYSKYAWMSFLQQKYGTIQALNTAWGSNYTTFGDSGGYGVGTGLLDEDGRHTLWLGSDPFMLRGAQSNVVTDMNAFLYQYAYQYAITAVKAIRTYDKNHLIFGPAALGAGGYEDRPQVLQALSHAGINVFQMGAPYTGDMSGHRATYDLTGKPIYLWYGSSANADSALHAYKQQQGVPDLPTQSSRARQYASDLETFFSAKGSNGDNYILGIDWWELTDGNVYEKTNWGLVSDRDNAYNGYEATSVSVIDSGGYKTIPEDRNYGDFIDPITRTHSNILLQLINEW